MEALDTALEAGGSLLSTWKDSVKDDLPPFLRDIDTLEREATGIDLISPVTVPGLLWCQSYAELVYRAGRKVTDVPRLAQLRSQRLSQLRAHVYAVFPMTALSGVSDPVRTQQVEHLLSLPERVTVHLLPEGTMLLGIPSPMMVFRLGSSREVVVSDLLEGNQVYSDAVLPRARELVRDALSVSLPPMISMEKLRGLVS